MLLFARALLAATAGYLPRYLVERGCARQQLQRNKVRDTQAPLIDIAQLRASLGVQFRGLMDRGGASRCWVAWVVLQHESANVSAPCMIAAFRVRLPADQPLPLLTVSETGPCGGLVCIF